MSKNMTDPTTATTHPCPRCGEPTTGTTTPAGFHSRMCKDCLRAENNLRDELEREREAAILAEGFMPEIELESYE